MYLLASLALVAATLLSARRFGVRRVALPAGLPLVLSFTGPFQWMLLSGLAPAPLIGLLAAVQVERGRGYGQVVAAASVPGLVLALTLSLGLFGGSRPSRELVEAVSASLAQVAGEAELPEAETLRELVELTVRLLPAMAYLSLLLAAILGYRVAQAIGVRTGVWMPAALPLRLWRLWEELIWVPVGALVLVLLAAGALRDLALNALLVMVVLFAVQGLALVRYLMWRLGAQRVLEVPVYVLLAFTAGVSVVALAGAGLADAWFDWRRLGYRRDEPDSDQEIEP